jgi:hypothetical protein
MNFQVDRMSFGGGAHATVLHPVVAAVMILAIILIFTLPRRYVVIPFLFSVLLIPEGQEILVAGAHLYIPRLLILSGCLRLGASKAIWRRKIFPGGFTTLDKVFLAWATLEATATILFFKEMGAVVSQAGFLWDALGGYFLLRCLIQNDEDIIRVIKTFAVVAIISGLAMLHEHFTGIDTFGFLGGIRQVLEVRLGTPRAQGPFAHALLAGTFGATLPPLLLWLWKDGKSRFLAVMGMVGCTLMASTTMCSSPVLTYAASLGAICLWPIRNRMRFVRWGIVLACIGLQLVMKAPFWFAVAHIDLTGSSNGWYRAALVDNFIKHFNQWWLIGTTANRNWADGAMWDVCNQFVFEGTNGGLAALVCFIAMICIGFRYIGKARRSAKGDKKREWFFWLLGATLFAHVVAFFGIDYFDQMKFVWYVLLAMIVAAAAAPATATVPIIAKSLPLEPSRWQVEAEGFGPLLEGKPVTEPESPSNRGSEGDPPLGFSLSRNK